METRIYKKILLGLLYLVLATISCWATAQSLSLSLPKWSEILCWLLTIAFFIIASFGLKLILDSFDKNNFVEHRWLKLLGGIFILLGFWIMFSMPTNTHSFFYWNSIDDVLTKDIVTTRDYLRDLENNTITENKIRELQTKLKNDVYSKLAQLESEISNPANPGDGPETKKRVAELAVVLDKGYSDIYLSGIANTPAQRRKLCDAYRNEVNVLLEEKLLEIANNNRNQKLEAQFKKEATVAIARIEAIEKKMHDINDPLDTDNSKVMMDVCARLHQGYVVIQNNKDYINFNNVLDEEKYAPAVEISESGTKIIKPVITDTKRFLSVYEVWKDYLTTDRYKGMGMGIWILASILCDVAAFVYFDLMFKKEY